MQRAATTIGRMAAITAIEEADQDPRRLGLKGYGRLPHPAAPSPTARPPARLEQHPFVVVILVMGGIWIEMGTAWDASSGCVSYRSRGYATDGRRLNLTRHAARWRA
jgi:hypothetical protein